MMTRGRWLVVRTLRGAEEAANGRVVTNLRGVVVADCRNDHLHPDEQKANAVAIGALPQMISALRMTEAVIGDLPRSDLAQRLHATVCEALASAGLPVGEHE